MAAPLLSSTKPNEEFTGLTTRLGSFATFPRNTCYNSTQLARLGYKYVNGYVCCSSCPFQEEPYNTDISTMHKNTSSNCSIALRHGLDSNTGNMVQAFSAQSTQITPSSDCFGESIPSEFTRVLDDSFFKRLLTFKYWDTIDDKGVSAISCAMSGLQYPAENNQPVVECQCCDLLLKPTPSMDLMIEHASRAPQCSFVISLRGAAFPSIALKVKEIALKKAEQSFLAKGLDAAKAHKAEILRDGLSQEDADWFAVCVEELTQCGFPSKVVLPFVAKQYLKRAELDEKIKDNNTPATASAVAASRPP